MAPERLETARLWLHRWSEQYTELLVRLASNRDVVRFIGPGEPWPGAMAKEVAAARRQHWTDHKFGWPSAIDEATGDLSGFMALDFAGEGTARLDAAEYEPGSWLAPHAWGRRLAREGARAMRAEAFEALNARASLLASSRPTRAPSRSPRRPV